jgi:hypothetical protein
MERLSEGRYTKRSRERMNKDMGGELMVGYERTKKALL